MIHLYQLPGAWGVSSVSPFCVKLEAYLRFAGLPFETRFGDPRKAPRGKVPWLEDDGVVVADSQRAISHLVAKHSVALDERLSASERTLGHALRRMLEEGTYFGMVWLRWGDPKGWAAYRPILVGMAPPVIGGAVIGLIRRQLLGQLRVQGVGRFEEQEKQELVIRDFAALAQALGDKPFLFGDQPTSFDATAYAFVASLLAFPVSSPARDFAEKCENLVAYKNRVTARYFA
ncbi:MAG: glutathione S-transferase family protein [Polyangiaceae bacterium]|nr:glutathione S-transferase family protein [Polyangiaceae bacterium]MBK8940850.1 glutathione S-transferase family protein [Polyangiaceae bacterium]